jgi:drug/metabolite transporter (DMT)-like permease
MTKWLLVGIIVSCNACGDLMNTLGMRRNGKVTDLAPSGIARLVRSLARNKYVIGGIAAMAVSFFALMSLLSIANVSFAIPATAGSFLIETALAKLILKEDVRWQRWLGASVVACGVALLALQ